jgi:hypothetical protein
LKRCTKCRKEKDEAEFRKRSNSDALRSECKRCLAARSAAWFKANPKYKSEWRADNPELETAIRRRAERKRKYGLTEDDYRKLLKQQDNKCIICEQEFADTPNVDHNHRTGNVRGLLCRPCNRGLGMFKDDALLVYRALRYLTDSDGPYVIQPN